MQRSETLSPLSRAAAVALPRTSLSLPSRFIGLVYSKFKLIKIKLKKVNYNVLLFLGAYKYNACYGPLPKIAAPPPPPRAALANLNAAQNILWLAYLLLRLRGNVGQKRIQIFLISILCDILLCCLMLRRFNVHFCHKSSEQEE
jgi:hypothetical protein